MEKSAFEKLLDYCNENGFDRYEVQSTVVETEDGPAMRPGFVQQKSGSFIELLGAARSELAVYEQMREEFDVIRSVNAKLHSDSPITSLAVVVSAADALPSKISLQKFDVFFGDESEPAFLVGTFRGVRKISALLSGD